MVRDGIYYGLAFIALAVLVAWLTLPALAIVPLLLAAFFMWFFRDPERQIPAEPGVIVSPGDGKVTDVSVIEFGGTPHTRVSIFLNVVNVHVNRSPISGVLTDVEYRRGKFRNAMGAISAEENEQNIATVIGDDGQKVIFKQIAGLLARRIVFTKKQGDRVKRGERVGLIKFGSRVDVIFAANASVSIKVGDSVKGGSSALGRFPVDVHKSAILSGERVESR
jgi:phosphatidylserine decarboxylase